MSAVASLHHQAKGLGLSKGCRGGGPGKSSEGLCHGGRLIQKHEVMWIFPHRLF